MDKDEYGVELTLDITDLKKKTKEAKKELSELEKPVETKIETTGMDTLQKQMKKIQDDMARLVSNINKTKDLKGFEEATQNFEKALDRDKQKLQELQQQMGKDIKMPEMPEIQGREVKIDGIDGNYILNVKKQVEETTEAFENLGSVTDRIKSGEIKIHGLEENEEEMKEMARQWDEYVEKTARPLEPTLKTVFDDTEIEQGLENVRTKANNITYTLQDRMDAVADIIKGGAVQGFNNLKDTAKEAGQHIKDALNPKNVASRLLGTLKSIGNGISNLVKKSNNFGKSIKKSLDKSVGTMKKFALSLFGIQTAYRAVSKAVSSYLSYDQELSKSIQTTWAGLGSFLAPVLEYIVGVFKQLLAYINAVVTALTGINFIARANAKALKNAGKSASGAGKEAQKALAPFDELNNINQDTGSSGGGASIDPIEIPEVDASKLIDFFKKLKDMFNKGKYFEMGKLIGQKITDALNSIDWTSIQATAEKIGTGIADFLNGALYGTDWTVVGNTFAQGINTVISFAYGFVTKFDWAKFGKSIGEFLFNAFHNIDWVKLAQTISETLKGIFTTISSAIQEIDWGTVARDVEKFVSNVDWSGIAKSILEAIGSAFGALISILGQWIKDAWNGVKKYFDEWIDKAEEQGGNIWDGILMGIGNAVKNIGNWIKENVLNPFVDGFKKAFKIHSPSKVMEELGGFIVDGFKNGIKTLWDKVKSIFTDLKNNIKTKITDIATNGKNWASDIGTKIKDGIKNSLSNLTNIFSNLFKGPLNAVISLVNKMINKINSKLSISISGTLAKVLSALGVNVSKGKYQLFSIPNIPTLRVGTDNVYEDGLAYLHKGEKVVPADVAKGGYSGPDNEETNNLLRQLIEAVNDKDYKPYITVDDIGKASVNYIRKKSRIEGEAII